MIFNSPFSLFNNIGNAKIIFVQDFLLSDLIGGAELSMNALHESAPSDITFKVIRSNEIGFEHLEFGKNSHWVFGNFVHINPQILYQLSKSQISYSVYEHDYKFCRWRSVERHHIEGGEMCNCANQEWGKLIEEFYKNAQHIWFCSIGQQERYYSYLPNLKKYQQNHTILSAVFGEDFFRTIVPLIQSLPARKKKGWLALNSESWIKGTREAESWLRENNKDYYLLKNLKPHEVLEAFANAEGFVCLPRGADVSNRMVTEAKILGCQVIVNENVQHASENWLQNSDLNYTLNWLYGRRTVFWDQVRKMVKV